MKHTPGPWSIQSDVRTAINAGIKHIAMVNYWKQGKPEDLYGEEHDANVNLIAAAPELLAALEACHDVLLMDLRYETGRARLMAEKAIARAKGELK